MHNEPAEPERRPDIDDMIFGDADPRPSER